MHPRIDRLAKEEGIILTTHEVWHNQENDELCMKYDNGSCGGIPFFYNAETQESLCGEVTYNELKDWAMKKCT